MPGAPTAAASRRFSATASFGKRLLRWNEREMPRRATACGASPPIGAPSKRMRPDVGASWPVMTLNSVVLPAPLGPMMARRSRGATSSVTRLSALSAPKARLNASVARSGGGHARRPTRPRSAPTMPPGAKSTKRMNVAPRISIQRSV